VVTFFVEDFTEVLAVVVEDITEVEVVVVGAFQSW
jgi:hypothetical protein